jgi:pimeloyl-ACP methyl ester carboxylesterase
MATIQVNGLTIYYESSGAGHPLVLLPGLLGTLESDWLRFIPQLNGRFQVIAADLRGHGKTDNPRENSRKEPGELSLDLMAGDLIGLLDKLGLENASVLGYSLGGCVGLLAGIKYPGRIRALVMHATKFFWDAASISNMVADMQPEIILQKSPRYANNLQMIHRAIYGDNYWQTLLRAAARFVPAMPETAPNLDMAAGVEFPVLVSVGSHDKLVGLEEAVRLYRAFPKGELLVIPGVRHSIQRVAPATFIPVVDEFLKTC